MDWITELLSDPASLSVQDGAALLVVLIILVLGGLFGSSSRAWAQLREKLGKKEE